MKMSIRFTLISAAFGLLSSSAAFAEADGAKLAQAVKLAVAADKTATLQIVQKEITANPGCACEVVKAAIEGSKADAALVASIVETASVAAPEHMRLISQCAVAVAPDALADVQAVLVKLDPNSGESAPVKSDAKSAKAGAVAPPVTSNPLDFPGSGIDKLGGRRVVLRVAARGEAGASNDLVGPNPGGPGGMSLLPFGPQLTMPPTIAPPIAPPSVTIP
ncbi:MAG: hypothetical protein RLZZ282_1036 [Verrucomicrobiota bacterium]|jgi:hypothetical protein